MPAARAGRGSGLTAADEGIEAALKIAGRLAFEQGRYDLGLNLKSPDGLCVVGYTRKKVGGPSQKNNNNSKNRK